MTAERRKPRASFGKSVIVGTAGAQVAGANENRRYITFTATIGTIALSNFATTGNPDPNVVVGVAIAGLSTITLDAEVHGDIVQQPWFGAGGSGSTVAVIESMYYTDERSF